MQLNTLVLASKIVLISILVVIIIAGIAWLYMEL